ncbi:MULTISPECIES: hypothetical protein [Pseudomonas]|jgi:hypothetical protein|uniref:hypothetical protein n=1 Tax=Pseudomonas TaxID=286 RepID=UPI00058A7002|nr:MULTISPECIES: hypothetical protein [Pseudomonas]KAE9648794.1 hypothetical protein EJA70_00615 [Pseudomonas sp. PB103]MBC8785975.1 hypothetical protein [Pseudomonas fluorescens]MBX4138786.1 hypothetical protein [Pseudomonas sp. S5F11]MDN6863817.1 hypothetical protein [Pseudomonas rhodesiae]CEL29275.1 hypothetical protein SRM1_02626 [Pseudomonas fluorescens]
MNSDPKLQGGMGEDDPMPTSPDPLSPGRTEVDPMKEEGVDELPDNEGERPLDDDDVGLDPERVREETDNAVMDNQQDPR